MAPKCRICVQVYNETTKKPLSLPCGHTFCKECVSALLAGGSSLRCSTCRRNHTNVDKEKLTVNYDLLSASITSSSVEEPSAPQASQQDGITLVIRDLNDKNFRLKVPVGATVRKVKEVLQQQHGIIPENTRLMFRGRRLEDHKTITFYNIQNGNIVQMLATYVGGCVLAAAV